MSSTLDWPFALEDSDQKVLLRLPFRRLARVPPPKVGGLPLGHELRILGRFLAGGTSSLDPSAFTRGYLALMRRREQLLFRALVIREALPAGPWIELLGDTAHEWIERGLLVDEGEVLRSRFAVIPVGKALFVVDPQEKAFPGKVHIGQDSLNFLQFMKRHPSPPGGRVLDVGTGSGVLLIALSNGAREGVGVDVNPRAVRVARFNARLNGLADWTVEETDVLTAPPPQQRFDLAMWNAPFMFFPESERVQNLDGYGGELGIEISLAFLERLPDLLNERGRATVMTAAPVMVGGENRLESELHDRCPRLELDVEMHVLQSFWSPHLAAFHSSHGIDRFESVILDLKRGEGAVNRRSPGMLQGVADATRRLLYQRARAH